MLVLAMDTATPRTVVAVLQDRSVLGEIGEPSRNHSVTLLPAVDRLLAGLGLDRRRIEAVATGIGPGSFTGLRVGLAMAKTMAFSLDIPLVGVSTLGALALNGRSAGVERICPVLDALKNEVYCAVFAPGEGEPVRLQDEGARDPQRWAGSLNEQPGPCLFLGTGAERYRTVLSESTGSRGVFPDDPSLHQVRASAVGILALSRLEAGETDDPYRLEPNYCRLSEAEQSRRAK